MRVDIWSDVVCPFCYIGKKRLEHVAAEAGIVLDIHWHSFELDPDAPTYHDTSNTERLATKYGRSLDEMREMQKSIATAAASEGITFDWEKASSGNTFDAHRLLHLAERQGMGDQLNEALFYAYMTKGAKIGLPEVLEKVAIEAGLTADDVRDVLDSDVFAKDVREDEIMAQQLQITGVPFFIFNETLALSGAQPREVFLQAMQQSIQTATKQLDIEDAAQCEGDQCDSSNRTKF